MPLFNRRPGLPEPWRSSLFDAVGSEPGRAARPQVLAWSPAQSRAGGDEILVATTTALWIGIRDVTDDRQLAAPQWQRIGWHEIESGGWSGVDQQLSWVLTSRRRGSAQLSAPQPFAQVFRERVAASIVVKQHLEVDGTRNGITLSARRDLEFPDRPLIWQTHPGKGTKMSDTRVAALAERALRQLQSDYDLR